jgi:GNAT superfamily N-acetyltransferase
MTLRKAKPQEAEILWNIRNQAIRHGCKTSYDADVIARWTPDLMPERYRQMVIEYPFYVVEDETGDVAATGYLDLDTHCLEAIFTLPAAFGKGMATRIIEALKNEARSRGITRLRLDATPNAQSFIRSWGLSRCAKTIITRVWQGLIYAVLKWRSTCNVRNTWLSR